MKSLALIATTLTLALAPAAALAGSYEALCGGTKCTIQVSPQGIDSPQGSIPASRVSYWSVNGESSTSVGTGVATTILFGGIGLLGFLAKNHDFDFTVDGYDAEGRRVAMQFKFKNNKPAKRLTSELYQVSGLAMGRQRSINEIQAIESGEAPLNAMQGTIEPALATTKQRQLNCGRVLQDYNCNYDAYLEANPSVKAWAESNPELAAKERVRLGALTQEEVDESAKPKSSSLGSMQQTLAPMNREIPNATSSFANPDAQGDKAQKHSYSSDEKPVQLRRIATPDTLR